MGAFLEWRILAPIAVVSVGAMLVLLIEAFGAPRAGCANERAPSPPSASQGVTLAAISTLALAFALYFAASMFADGTIAVFNPAHPMIRLDPFSSFATLLVAAGALLSIWLSVHYLPALHIDHGEYYALLLLSTVGMFLLVSAVDTLALFLGLELMSIPVYVLAGFDRRRLRSNESGLKYFLVGAFASAILLYGIALLYGATGHTNFSAIRAAFDPDSPLTMAGLGLMTVGFAFKIASVPFHQWAPDVYEGAPTAVTAFMSVSVKAAAFAILVRFLWLALPELGQLAPVLWLMAALSMLVGNAMAVIQSNLKRMLAYSSIAHAGYLLVGLVVATPEAQAALLFYLLAYLFTNLGAFGLIVALARGGNEADRIEDFAGLARSRPALAAAMTLFMISLAGIPGTAGFVAKFQIFSAAVNTDQIWLAIIGVLTSVVSLFYYLRVPIVMYMREPSDAGQPAGGADTPELAALGACAVAVVWLGLFPNHDPFFGALRALDLTRAAAGALLP